MSIVTRAPRFDLTGLDFRYVGFVPLDDAPAYPEAPSYCPTPVDMAWCLGYELEQMGERAMIRTIDGYTPEEHQAFANGQRQARADMGRPPVKPAPMSHEALLGGLLTLARAYEAEGDEMGRYLAAMIRDHATEAEGYGSRTWNEFDARRQSEIDDLRRYRDDCLCQVYGERQ